MCSRYCLYLKIVIIVIAIIAAPFVASVAGPAIVTITAVASATIVACAAAVATIAAAAGSTDRSIGRGGECERPAFSHICNLVHTLQSPVIVSISQSETGISAASISPLHWASPH